mmetsp:Transcript_2056/g.4331  ORF Transcript_2056/g.4331 Transcript_2056/m.4331 type:complete len:330 (-) Transcript_2056:739-1728(-)
MIPLPKILFAALLARGPATLMNQFMSRKSAVCRRRSCRPKGPKYSSLSAYVKENSFTEFAISGGGRGNSPCSSFASASARSTSKSRTGRGMSVPSASPIPQGQGGSQERSHRRTWKCPASAAALQTIQQPAEKPGSACSGSPAFSLALINLRISRLPASAASTLTSSPTNAPHATEHSFSRRYSKVSTLSPLAAAFVTRTDHSASGPAGVIFTVSRRNSTSPLNAPRIRWSGFISSAHKRATCCLPTSPIWAIALDTHVRMAVAIWVLFSFATLAAERSLVAVLTTSFACAFSVAVLSNFCFLIERLTFGTGARRISAVSPFSAHTHNL